MVITGADIAIYSEGGDDSQTVPSTPNQPLSTPTLTVPVKTTILNDDEPYTAVIVYNEGQEPVTHIELLSPSNKPGYKNYNQYMSKREDTLKSGLSLVEIDYLHTTKPILGMIPSYKDRDAKAYPYMILVSDTRPTWERGSLRVYGFNVLDTLPIIKIPLKGKDTVQVNFGEVYNTTFMSSRAFSQIFSNTNKTPTGFDAYTENDQQQINTHKPTTTTNIAE